MAYSLFMPSFYSSTLETTSTTSSFFYECFLTSTNKVFFLLMMMMILLLIGPGVSNSDFTEKGHYQHHHCLVAQRMCLDDSTCSLLLNNIYEMCGHIYENSCLSVDDYQCRVSLTSLKQHGIFVDSCVCTDEISDIQCHKFHDYIFKNPCIQTSGKGMFGFPLMPPKQQTPSCNYAFTICSQSDKCSRTYQHFQKVCKMKNGNCDMISSVKCQRAMDRLQMTPLYGCHCHRTEDDTDCETIYQSVNSNPCIEALRLQTNLRRPPSDKSDTSIVHSDNVQDRNTVHQEEEKIQDNPSETQLSRPTPSSTQYLHHHNNNNQKHKHHHGSDGGHHRHRQHQRQRQFNWSTSTDSTVQQPSLTSEERNFMSPQDSAKVPTVSSSTCARAQDACERDSACHLLLENVYLTCDENGATCNQTECMAAIRNFYHLGNPDKTFDIAFCSCRSDDEVCIASQRQLHPACAQSVSGNQILECTDITELCETKGDCKYRLQRFVESCAVDRTTLRCSSSSRACQEALVGILGTPLRTTCGCSGKNIISLYRCIDWQRVVWLNPCVVQAQKDFLENRVNSVPMLPRQETNVALPVDVVSTTPSTTTVFHEPFKPRVMTTTTTTQRTTTITTKTTTTPSTDYCILKKPDRSGNITISRETGTRVYHKNEPDCSYVCMCKDLSQLVCEKLPCVERLPCQTTFAVYSHASPAYQAYRGRCICYSGKFICMKPQPSLYSLRQGIFLFLGYSELEENMLSRYTHKNIIDSVQHLQDVVENPNDEGGCKLQIFEHINDNIVLQAYLEEFAEDRENNSITESMVTKEKERCYTQLKNLSDLINNNDPHIKKDVIMSVFKLAEVEVHVRTPSMGHHQSTSLISTLSLIIFAILLTL